MSELTRWTSFSEIETRNNFCSCVLTSLVKPPELAACRAGMVVANDPVMTTRSNRFQPFERKLLNPRP